MANIFLILVVLVSYNEQWTNGNIRKEEDNMPYCTGLMCDNYSYQYRN